jgi:hypothetical protein
MSISDVGSLAYDRFSIHLLASGGTADSWKTLLGVKKHRLEAYAPKGPGVWTLYEVRSENLPQKGHSG